MDGEHRGYEGAAPQAPSYMPQNQKQQHRVGGVPQDVDQVMPARAQPEDLAVQRMGKSGERNPVGHLHMGKSPAHRAQGQTLFDRRVVINIKIIIKIDKPEPLRLSEYRPNRQRQKDTNAHRLPSRLLSGRPGRLFDFHGRESLREQPRLSRRKRPS